MNIAILTDTYLPQINGVVTSTVTFTNSYESMDHNVLILGPKMEGAKETDNVWRLRSVVFPFQPEHRLIWPITRKVKVFGERNIDIIHVQTPFSMGLLGQYLGKKYKIPVIHTYHTLFSEYMHYVPIIPHNLADKAVSTVSRLFCNRCETIVVPSGKIKDKLEEYGVKKPIKILPTGVSLTKINAIKPDPDFKSKLGFHDHHKVLIFVGRLGLEKNVYFLLDSFKKIHAAVPNTKLLVIGDGPERDGMRDKATQLDLKDDVVFTGYVNHDDVFRAFAISELFLFPSKTETQGLSIVEGFAKGIPSICIKAMGVEDVLDNNKGGFLTEDSLEDYSEKAISLLKDDQLLQTKKQESLRKSPRLLRLNDLQKDD